MTVTVETSSAGQWIAVFTLLLVVATFSGAAVAVLQDWIRSFIWHPELDLKITPRPPDCHKIPMTWQTQQGIQQADCYYLRAQIDNTGKQAAELVEVFLGEVRQRTPNGRFERRQAFMPMNLVWAHFNTPFLHRLSPHLPKHCNVAHVLKPSERARVPGSEDNPDFDRKKTALSLDLVVSPNTLSHLLPPGTFRLKLVLGAANTKPKTKWVEIALTGQWFDDENQMLSEGLQVRLLSDSEVEPIAP